jgi:WhiB family redox-sensing transcriptional regulator
MLPDRASGNSWRLGEILPERSDVNAVDWEIHMTESTMTPLLVGAPLPIAAATDSRWGITVDGPAAGNGGVSAGGGQIGGLMPFVDAEPAGAAGWQEQALCAQTDPEAFFPEKGGSTREAKRVCLSCDVRTECLEYALENDERFGIWGGLSERERRRLKRAAG